MRYALLLVGVMNIGCENPNLTLGDTPEVKYPLDDVLRVHHLQMKGTHNSYHRLSEVDADQWRYDHLPLYEQLSHAGVRAFELDIWRDPNTGELRVFHLAQLDDQSTCSTLRSCLREIAEWSMAYPEHAPLFVQLETKNEDDQDDAVRFAEQIEDEVAISFARPSILTPDDVRGDAESLSSALIERGWPTLAKARGRTVIWLDSPRVAEAYSESFTTLDNRLMFVRAPSDALVAAIIKEDEPRGRESQIQAAVAAGRLVRTRADADGHEARSGDYGRAESGFSSGAHIVSTDFPDENPFVDYEVHVPDGTPVGCNPVTAPPACYPAAIESLDTAE